MTQLNRVLWIVPLVLMTFYSLNSNEMKIQLQRPAVWLVDADENWQAIIGALDVETITVNEEYSCQCNTPEGDTYDYPITDPDNCPDNCELLAGDPVNITIQVTKPNDGVVLKESASYMTGATADPVKLENSSHMQMRNDEELKKKLTNLYNGSYGDFFFTESRTE